MLGLHQVCRKKFCPSRHFIPKQAETLSTNSLRNNVFVIKVTASNFHLLIKKSHIILDESSLLLINISSTFDQIPFSFAVIFILFS